VQVVMVRAGKSDVVYPCMRSHLLCARCCARCCGVRKTNKDKKTTLAITATVPLLSVECVQGQGAVGDCSNIAGASAVLKVCAPPTELLRIWIGPVHACT
jgi:hypothetical protein